MSSPKGIPTAIKVLRIISCSYPTFNLWNDGGQGLTRRLPLTVSLSAHVMSSPIQQHRPLLGRRTLVTIPFTSTAILDWERATFRVLLETLFYLTPTESGFITFQQRNSSASWWAVLQTEGSMPLRKSTEEIAMYWSSMAFTF